MSDPRTDPQGDRFPRRLTDEVLPPSPPQRTISRPGASAFSVSDGPISSNSGRNGGKNAGRNCVSALPQRAIPGSDLLRILADIAFHHCCQSKGLRVRSPARRLPRPLASATAGVFHSYRHPPKPSPRVAHPLKPSPLMVRGVEWHAGGVSDPRADPQGDRWRAAPDEVSPRSGVTPPRPRRNGLFRAPAQATFVCGDKSSQKHRLDLRSKNPSRAILSCDFPHLLAGITFHHRCRSKGMRVRSPARRLTRPLASATAGIFRSYRRTPKPFPLRASRR